jgi:uncharacterized protein (TIGR00255 family)
MAMTNSMTAYATKQGALAPFSWHWDMRGVNSKGLDLRLRMPDWIDGLEGKTRVALTKAFGRGNIQVSLRVQRDDADIPLSLNEAMLEKVLVALSRVEDAAMKSALSLAPTSAADIMSIKGVLDNSQDSGDVAGLTKTLLSELDDLIRNFAKMRQTEGTALDAILQGQISRIETLTHQAAVLAEARKPVVAKNMQAALDRVVQDGRDIEPDRVAAELAFLAIKADVTEEIDRLLAHVSAARALLAEGTPSGRRLDFLSQEFNREANTLCAKSNDTELTAVGLALKAQIEQMREQIQNVE